MYVFCCAYVIVALSGEMSFYDGVASGFFFAYVPFKFELNDGVYSIYRLSTKLYGCKVGMVKEKEILLEES